MCQNDQSELEANIELDRREAWRAGVGQIDPLLPRAPAEKQPRIDVPAQTSSYPIAKKRTGLRGLRPPRKWTRTTDRSNTRQREGLLRYSCRCSSRRRQRRCTVSRDLQKSDR